MDTYRVTINIENQNRKDESYRSTMNVAADTILSLAVDLDLAALPYKTAHADLLSDGA